MSCGMGSALESKSYNMEAKSYSFNKCQKILIFLLELNVKFIKCLFSLKSALVFLVLRGLI